MGEYPVPGMHCMFCRYRLKAAIRKIDPGLEMRVDLQAGVVEVGVQEDIGTVERALAHLGKFARSQEGLGNGHGAAPASPDLLSPGQTGRCGWAAAEINRAGAIV